MSIYTRTLDLIGGTPLLQVPNIEKKYNLKANIYAKLEYFNPSGSVKDRAVSFMITDAREKGILKEGSVIIEPTSGNTGISLAVCGAINGYRVILTMPETMSVERRNILKAYGAEVVLTEGNKGMRGAIEKAKELVATIPDSFFPSQFENPANVLAHESTTGPEIFTDTQGKVDIFVAGVGTGGTVIGTGRYLKANKPEVKVIAVEPEESSVLAGGKVGTHKIQGIGAGFVPNLFEPKIVDEIIAVSSVRAFEVTREIVRIEGQLVGISSGAAMSAAITMAQRPENKGKNIVVVLPDSGDRYFSTPLFL
jgi:cysteine synthase A